jgi:hypothetical protein
MVPLLSRESTAARTEGDPGEAAGAGTSGAVTVGAEAGADDTSLLAAGCGGGRVAGGTGAEAGGFTVIAVAEETAAAAAAAWAECLGLDLTPWRVEGRSAWAGGP